MVLVALLSSMVLGILSFGLVYFINGNSEMGLVVAVALQGVVLLASFMGTSTPLVLDKLGVNPALAAGPFITTANDILGIIVYLAVANLLL